MRTIQRKNCRGALEVLFEKVSKYTGKNNRTLRSPPPPEPPNYKQMYGI
jgi:hypothetical protein